MTNKERKINLYIKRVERFNELCPSNGFLWGSTIIKPIIRRNLKIALSGEKEESIDRKIKGIEKFIKYLEGDAGSDGRKRMLPELKKYLINVKDAKIKISPSIKVFVNGDIRSRLSLLEKKDGKWTVSDYRGTVLKLKNQESALQREILFRLKAKYDRSIIPNTKTIFRAYS